MKNCVGKAKYFTDFYECQAGLEKTMKIQDGISARLKEERNRLGMTQTEFGVAGGVSLGTQSAYESAKTSPDLRYMAAIAAVGADVLYVLTGRPSAPMLQPDEAELLRRYRVAIPEVRVAVLGALGVMATAAAGRISITGGEQGQVVAGDAHQEKVSFSVGGARRSRKS